MDEFNRKMRNGAVRQGSEMANKRAEKVRKSEQNRRNWAKWFLQCGMLVKTTKTIAGMPRAFVKKDNFAIYKEKTAKKS